MHLVRGSARCVSTISGGWGWSFQDRVPVFLLAVSPGRWPVLLGVSACPGWQRATAPSALRPVPWRHIATRMGHGVAPGIASVFACLLPVLRAASARMDLHVLHGAALNPACRRQVVRTALTRVWIWPTEETSVCPPDVRCMRIVQRRIDVSPWALALQVCAAPSAIPQ